MIQRIQTLYLLLTAIVLALFLNGNFLNLSGSAGHNIVVKLNGVYQSAGGTTFELVHHIFPFTLIAIIMPVIAFITIFFFKYRKFQAILTLILIILEIFSIVMVVHLAISISTSQSAVLRPGFKLVLPLAGLLFSILSYKSIKKDTELVKSYDRLR